MRAKLVHKKHRLNLKYNPPLDLFDVDDGCGGDDDEHADGDDEDEHVMLLQLLSWQLPLPGLPSFHGDEIGAFHPKCEG